MMSNQLLRGIVIGVMVLYFMAIISINNKPKLSDINETTPIRYVELGNGKYMAQYLAKNMFGSRTWENISLSGSSSLVDEKEFVKSVIIQNSKNYGNKTIVRIIEE